MLNDPTADRALLAPFSVEAVFAAWRESLLCQATIQGVATLCTPNCVRYLFSLDISPKEAATLLTRVKQGL